MISHRHKCILIHVPRTAGTAIEVALTGYDWWEREPWLKHIPASDAARKYAQWWDHYTTVAVYRPFAERKQSMWAAHGDPYAREWSYWIDRPVDVVLRFSHLARDWAAFAPRINAPMRLPMIGRSYGIRINYMHPWHDGFEHEKLFWEGWARRGEAQLMAAERPLAHHIGELIPAGVQQPQILDVGSGAISLLGRSWMGRQVSITQVDVLTYWYQRLLHRHGVSCPNVAYASRGEDMLHALSQHRFDVVVAQNSLDHTERPDLVLRNMAAITNGPIYLKHYQEIGARLQYAGLHQWNAQLRDGKLVFWNPDGETIDVSAVTGAKHVRHWTTDCATSGYPELHWVGHV